MQPAMCYQTRTIRPLPFLQPVKSRIVPFQPARHLQGLRHASLSALGPAADVAQHVQGQEQQVSNVASALSTRAHALLYTLSDAAASPATVTTAKKAGGWLQPLSDGLEAVLYTLQKGLETLHVPYSYGFSIILLTLMIKIVTYPLTKQQVESAMAVQTLKPRIDLIKARFGEDKDRIQLETSRLYEQAGVNPLAGCLPTLATIPIFIGLYNSLTNAASTGAFDTQGFFWIPSLAGPTTILARQSGNGTAWLFPFVDGHPPIGWHDASLYLVLPVLLVVSQWVSSAIISPVDPNDPNANTQKALYTFLPLMVGWFSLNVPSGLSLYYLANTVLTSAVQIYLKKLGGAEVKINDLGPVTKPGSGRRTGAPVTEFAFWEPTTVLVGERRKAAEEAAAAASEAALDGYEDSSSGSGSEAAAAVSASSSQPAEASVVGSGASASSNGQLPSLGSQNLRVKRKKLSLIQGTS